MSENPIKALMELKETQSREIENPELETLYQTNPLIGAGGLIEGLTDDQQRFLVAKMYGGTDVAAARASGVNEHTMRNWKGNNAQFREVYDMVVDMPVEMAARVSAFGFAKAIDKIVRMMDANDIKVQMWAIEKILGIANVGKQRIEVTHKKEVAEDDVDRILQRLEERDRELKSE